MVNLSFKWSCFKRHFHREICESFGRTRCRKMSWNDLKLFSLSQCCQNKHEQGKSEGFESCDRPIVRKHPDPIWVKIGDVLSRVNFKFDGWPWKTIGHLSFAVSSFVQHFIAIGEFKLELLSGNAQFGSNSTIFRAVWPWNLTDDLCASFCSHRWIQAGVTVRKRPIWVKIDDFFEPCDLAI